MGSVATEQHTLSKETKPTFPSGAGTLDYAKEQDAKCHMRRFRDQFIIPSKANLKATKVEKPGMHHLRNPTSHIMTPLPTSRNASPIVSLSLS